MIVIIIINRVASTRSGWYPQIITITTIVIIDISNIIKNTIKFHVVNTMNSVKIMVALTLAWVFWVVVLMSITIIIIHRDSKITQKEIVSFTIV